MTRLETILEGVQTRDDLARFVGSLAEELHRAPEIWENANLADYLRALSAWIMDMDGYFLNQGIEPPTEPSWKTFGMMLMAARVYE